MFGIIIKNLLGFDFLIIILGLVNGFYVLPRAKSATEVLKEKLQPTIYVPINVLLKSFSQAKEREYDLHEIKSLKDKEAFYMNILLTIMSVFPLLGILGTIISLLRMVDIGSTEILFNFTTALTSTFWGLVMAITFKGLTTNLVSGSEQNSENFELLVRRIDSAKGLGDVDEEA